MIGHLKSRDCVTVSIHSATNDRGDGVADAELGFLAGADRIEGTLFGNGERTGNVDFITLAMNMYCQGSTPISDFSDMPVLKEPTSGLPRMKVYERSPYCGAGAGLRRFLRTHQDAIARGFAFATDRTSAVERPLSAHRPDRHRADLYEADVIRINSQSGKGGISYVLEQQFGINMPTK
jgi:2-isopropylmalate synthase